MSILPYDEKDLEVSMPVRWTAVTAILYVLFCTVMENVGMAGQCDAR